MNFSIIAWDASECHTNLPASQRKSVCQNNFLHVARCEVGIGWIAFDCVKLWPLVVQPLGSLVLHANSHNVLHVCACAFESLLATPTPRKAYLCTVLSCTPDTCSMGFPTQMPQPRCWQTKDSKTQVKHGPHTTKRKQNMAGEEA